MMAHGGLDYIMNKHITKFSLKIVKRSMPIEMISNIDVSALARSAQQATEAMQNISSALAQTQVSVGGLGTAMQAYNILLDADTQELINQLMGRWANI
jgi:hypothetical protein